ncbi:tetratricopeptide repeat protein [Catellatospora aurea]|uniref:Tetratricopeptide repeat protein n=1 Tax=Catellatospora aurea TaxID=1337874 RepID=A0ABW2H5E3_9ACTN
MKPSWEVDPRERRLVPTYRGELASRVARARALQKAGDYPAAAECLRQAITEGESWLGADAHELVVALNELGILCKYSGYFDEAEQVYRRALSIEEAQGPAATADLASLLHNIAGLAHARGDASSAEPLARRGIAVRSAMTEVNQEALARDRAAWAAILIDLDRLTEAQAILSEVLAAYENVPTPDRYEIAVTLHNLGSLQARAGEHATAVDTLSRAYALKRASLGRRHPDLAITLYNLGRCLQNLGRSRAAKRRFRRAVDILGSRVTDDHPTLAACRDALSR